MSAWEQACRTNLELARSWDQSEAPNRWAVRHWRHRLWWARFGVYVSAVAGVALGVCILAVGYVALVALGGVS